jgi:ribonuclease BN (tRNA processing enzyme)
MRLKFHGCRGSHPVSAPPSRIKEIIKDVWTFAQEKKVTSWNMLEAALEQAPQSLSSIWGGNTTCVEVKSDLAPMPLFLDAGTGFTQAGMDPNCALTKADFAKGTGKVAIFLSHTHWDHIIGLITVEQIFKGNEVHFYGVHKNLSERIKTLFIQEHFPVPFHVVEPNFKFHQIPLNTPIQFGGLNINHFAQSHPGGSFAYRITEGKSSMVFATDTELKNTEQPHMTPGSNLYSNSDVLIVDAQFSPEEFPSRQGYGHSQIYMAVDFAVREKTKHLYLFHQSPYYSDKEIDEQLRRAQSYLVETHGASHPMKISMACEGSEIGI